MLERAQIPDGPLRQYVLLLLLLLLLCCSQCGDSCCITHAAFAWPGAASHRQQYWKYSLPYFVSRHEP